MANWKSELVLFVNGHRNMEWEYVPICIMVVEKDRYPYKELYNKQFFKIKQRKIPVMISLNHSKFNIEHIKKILLKGVEDMSEHQLMEERLERR